MASPPEYLTLTRHRDLEGRGHRPWVRWGILTALGIVLLLGLLNTFGQKPDTDTATGNGVELELYSPTKLRSGLFFMSRFTITAEREVKKATLVLDSGWMEGMTLNSLEPGPLGEASRDGKLVLELGHVPAGQKHVLFLQFQVNPTNTGRRSQDVELLDDTTPLVSLDRTVTVFP